ncbi:MAG: hypothetical protein IJ057_02000 [Bacteroidales bacterium]|nr:hypothetical protein [Bacteroidales bacterium]
MAKNLTREGRPSETRGRWKPQIWIASFLAMTQSDDKQSPEGATANKQAT